jgi:hypothetical protein
MTNHSLAWPTYSEELQPCDCFLNARDGLEKKIVRTALLQPRTFELTGSLQSKNHQGYARENCFDDSLAFRVITGKKEIKIVTFSSHS